MKRYRIATGSKGNWTTLKHVDASHAVDAMLTAAREIAGGETRSRTVWTSRDGKARIVSVRKYDENNRETWVSILVQEERQEPSGVRPDLKARAYNDD